jgi:hypothetical protein
MRGILLPGRKLHFHSLRRAEEFKGNRLPAKGEIAKKLCKGIGPYIELGWQGSLEFDEWPPAKGHGFGFFFRFGNGRRGSSFGADCLAEFTNEGTEERWLAPVINDGGVWQVMTVKGDERGFGRHWSGKDLPTPSAYFPLVELLC